MGREADACAFGGEQYFPLVDSAIPEPVPSRTLLRPIVALAGGEENKDDVGKFRKFMEQLRNTRAVRSYAIFKEECGPNKIVAFPMYAVGLAELGLKRARGALGLFGRLRPVERAFLAKEITGIVLNHDIAGSRKLAFEEEVIRATNQRINETGTRDLEELQAFIQPKANTLMEETIVASSRSLVERQMPVVKAVRSKEFEGLLSEAARNKLEDLDHDVFRGFIAKTVEKTVVEKLQDDAIRDHNMILKRIERAKQENEERERRRDEIRQNLEAKERAIREAGGRPDSNMERERDVLRRELDKAEAELAATAEKHREDLEEAERKKSENEEHEKRRKRLEREQSERREELWEREG
jgi:hypothetical protein